MAIIQNTLAFYFKQNHLYWLKEKLMVSSLVLFA